ncbi:MAG: arginine repressor [Oscillospiraceae bacterium]|nr:arginine repressor [Oscillospiraceae bacterium]MBQ1805838.1 arginine repressor [Oscillospiraceae bacterium]MBQ2322991.1 arginine repressor [Oscillospiraceae bacterium]MBQ2606917.1 arginine repressor [Oscillospiraceae bacterium]MBQ5566871.1 arginine repressor [Oscillospiraceae bacterium]
MKNDRQEKILAIIAQEPIETQDQLIRRLAEQGIASTQATISRDIKQLHLVKQPTGGGRYRYAVSEQSSKINISDRLRTILHESIVSVDYAKNLIVLKTMPGLAAGAGAAFDGMEIPAMVGCLAGDDTVLIVMRDTDAARDFCDEIAGMQR